MTTPDERDDLMERAYRHDSMDSESRNLIAELRDALDAKDEAMAHMAGIITRQGDALDRVRARHPRKVGWLTGEDYCERCGRGEGWPCDTIRTIDGRES